MVTVNRGFQIFLKNNGTLDFQRNFDQFTQLPYTNRFTEKTTSQKNFFRIGAAFYLYFYSQIALDKNYEKLPGL